MLIQSPCDLQKCQLQIKKGFETRDMCEELVRTEADKVVALNALNTAYEYNRLMDDITELASSYEKAGIDYLSKWYCIRQLSGCLKNNLQNTIRRMERYLESEE